MPHGRAAPEQPASIDRALEASKRKVQRHAGLDDDVGVVGDASLAVMMGAAGGSPLSAHQKTNVLMMSLGRVAIAGAVSSCCCASG
jgi:hypothetical protein